MEGHSSQQCTNHPTELVQDGAKTHSLPFWSVCMTIIQVQLMVFVRGKSKSRIKPYTCRIMEMCAVHYARGGAVKWVRVGAACWPQGRWGVKKIVFKCVPDELTHSATKLIYWKGLSSCCTPLLKGVTAVGVAQSLIRFFRLRVLVFFMAQILLDLLKKNIRRCLNCLLFLHSVIHKRVLAWLNLQVL